MGSLRASTFVFATALMCAVFHLSNGLCRRNFFAQPVIYDKAMGIDFYFTGIGVPSVSACAEFCGARRFCRTAIFNSYTKTCAISYEYTLNCRYNKNRFTDFDVRQTTSNLIQVACVTKCGDDYMALMPPGKYRPLGMDTLHRPPKMLKKVELITGDPHDGKNLGRVLTEKESRVFVGTGTRTLKAKSNNGALLAIQALINSALPVDDGFLGLLTKRGRSQVCFRTIESRYLLGGAFEQHTTSSLDECRCLCAATYSTLRLHRCQSLQWYRDGKCVLNKGSHLGKYDLIEDKLSTYQFIACDVQVLLDVASKVCSSAKLQAVTTGRVETTSMKSTTRKSTVPVESTGIPTASWKFLTQVTTTVRPSTTTTTSPTSTTVITTEAVITTESTTTEETRATDATVTEESMKSFVTADSEEEEKEEEAASAREKSTSTPEKRIETEVTSTVMSSTISPKRQSRQNASEPDSLKIVNNDCFEEISGYMMTNVAGGLEHDVSMEECKCFCASSRASRRYSFECLSATYYHEERDCILNLDDRHRNPQLLEKQNGQYAVTYLAMTCTKEDTAAYLSKASFGSNCEHVTPPQTVTPTQKQRKTGANTDVCFLELSDFVLEGTALAIETAISHQECKCRCLNGETRYGEACQSFQYYFDSTTCLINKQNRFSNPENFNFVPNLQPRSYFEHRCATRDDVRRKYLEEFCHNDIGEVQNNTVSAGRKPKKSRKTASAGNKVAPSKPSSPRKTIRAPENLKSKDISNEETEHSSGGRKSNKSAAVEQLPPMVTEIFKKVTPGEPEWNTDNRTSGGYGYRPPPVKPAEDHFVIPEAESEEDSSVPMRKRVMPTTTTTTTRRPQMKRYVVRSYVNRNIPETDGLDETEFDKIIELELPDDFKGDPSKFVPPADVEHLVIQYPSRLSGVRSVKFDTKRKKWQEVEPTTTTATTTTATTTTTPRPTTTTGTEADVRSALVYPSVGRCTYSAMYQTAFQGNKMIRTIYVKSPADCFAACYAHSCRSANLISNGEMNTCELFRDSIIDYRSTGTIVYDGSTVFFDGIKCEGPQ